MTEETTANEAKSYDQYLSKAPTGLHQEYAKWLSDKVGIPAEQVDIKTVQLAVTLYGAYQKSPERAAAKEREAELKGLREAELQAAKAASGSTKVQREAKKALTAVEQLKEIATAAGDTDILEALTKLEARAKSQVALPGQARGTDIPEGGQVKDEAAPVVETETEPKAAPKPRKPVAGRKVDAKV